MNGMRESLIELSIAVTVFLFFALSPQTLVVLHEILELVEGREIPYDSVIGTNAVFIYIALAITLFIYLIISLYTNAKHQNKKFIKVMLLITTISLILGFVNYAIFGLAI